MHCTTLLYAGETDYMQCTSLLYAGVTNKAVDSLLFGSCVEHGYVIICGTLTEPIVTRALPLFDTLTGHVSMCVTGCMALLVAICARLLSALSLTDQ